MKSGGIDRRLSRIEAKTAAGREGTMTAAEIEAGQARYDALLEEMTPEEREDLDRLNAKIEKKLAAARGPRGLAWDAMIKDLTMEELETLDRVVSAYAGIPTFDEEIELLTGAAEDEGDGDGGRGVDRESDIPSIINDRE
jgi:hypothetical protein